MIECFTGIFIPLFSITKMIQKQSEKRFRSNALVTGSSNTNIFLYPSLVKRGMGRFSERIFKIPLNPPLPKGG
ncbi:MAG: hypothetical protein A2V86_11990 [Deltaproteobacteria bacterium RBG_16_49_23]|nr:MAG: hypothetical protein A2V86_11990 [Deltaproteobacteria bacterium RBG_16_49_23]